jgi:hypothetical protein
VISGRWGECYNSIRAIRTTPAPGRVDTYMSVCAASLFWTAFRRDWPDILLIDIVGGQA